MADFSTLHFWVTIGIVIIVSNPFPVAVDDDLVKMIIKGKGDWQLLQKKSVSISREKAQTLNLEITQGVFIVSSVMSLFYGICLLY